MPGRGHLRRAPHIPFNRQGTDSKLKDKEHFRRGKVVFKEDNLTDNSLAMARQKGHRVWTERGKGERKW